MINTLNERFNSRNFESTRSLENPYNQISKDLVKFREELLQDSEFSKLIKSQNYRKPNLAQAGLFTFTSNSEKSTWGIQDPDILQLAKSKIRESNERNGKSFDAAKIDQINDKLVSYSKDAVGVANILDDGLHEKGLSEIQHDVLKLIVSQISKADLHEAQLINTTVEHEVINSTINQNDKALILTINSILAQDVQEKLGKLSNSSNQGNEGVFFYRKTAAVIIVFIAATAVGAVVGGIIGLIGCCGDFNNPSACTFNCVAENIGDGARLGMQVGLLAAVI